MNVVDLIIKKRDGHELSEIEINSFITNVTNKTIPDYQISAMLMAMFIKGLNDNETACLTKAMAYSGEVMDLSDVPGIKVDKHSTGGIGDTTTLVLAPLVASCGLNVVKMSGRGLGFTGGTIDKMESIGLKVDVDMPEAIEYVKSSGVVVMSQTADLAPADKIFYALRDVTGTIDSIPLIAASIMSKKIAAGADAIVLDVKCGSGAFMKDFASAKQLAQTMVSIGKSVGRSVVALITNMDEPLGLNIGNTLEVQEAMDILQGKVTGPLLDVSIELGANMLVLGQKADDIEQARKMLHENIANGKGYDKFMEFVAQQSGNNKLEIACAKQKMPVISQSSGYVSAMVASEIGRASLETGAGRLTKEDAIDFTAGLVMKVRIGDYVNAGDEIAVIHSNSDERCSKAADILLSAIKISNDKPHVEKLILDVVR